MEKRCPRCTQMFVVPDGKKRSSCKPCTAAYARARRKEETPEQRAKRLESAARWRAANPEYAKAKNKAFYAENREREKARAAKDKRENAERNRLSSAAWRTKNKERHTEMGRAWRAANLERQMAYRREQHAKTKERANQLAREWKAKNVATCREYTARRVAAKKQAIPGWADIKKTRAVYEEARRLTVETGIPHHVDHIVPLQSDRVCGLHWHGNLKAIPAFDNQSKKNRYWPDMFGQEEAA